MTESLDHLKIPNNDDIKATLAKLAAGYGEHMRKHVLLKPGAVLEVTRDYGNPHCHPYVPNLRSQLVMVAEVQPDFVKVIERQRGITAEALRMEERVLVIAEGYDNPVMLSEFSSWVVYKSDAHNPGV